jgi:hypothetical protein
LLTAGVELERGRELETARENGKLETGTGNDGAVEGRRGQTNPMQLRDLKSIEYEKEARNKPNAVIRNYINMLRAFPALFWENMNDNALRFRSRSELSSMLSICR